MHNTICKGLTIGTKLVQPINSLKEPWIKYRMGFSAPVDRVTVNHPSNAGSILTSVATTLPRR